MNKKRKIVEFYEGFKSEELPVKFWFKEEEIYVKRIISSAYLGSTDPEKLMDRCFEVEGNNGKTYKIFYVSEIEEWIILEKI